MLSQDCFLQEQRQDQHSLFKTEIQAHKDPREATKLTNKTRQKNWLQNARTTGEIAPIVSMVLNQSNHICGLLPKLSAPIETPLPVQNTKRKFHEALIKRALVSVVGQKRAALDLFAGIQLVRRMQRSQVQVVALTTLVKTSLDLSDGRKRKLAWTTAQYEWKGRKIHAVISTRVEISIHLVVRSQLDSK